MMSEEEEGIMDTDAWEMEQPWPVKLAASITPWNYPLNMATWKLGPALATGKIDAVMTSGSTAVAQKYWEFLNHTYTTNHLWASNAMAVSRAAAEGLDNFSILVAHVLVPPAMEAILSSPTNRVQGFLAAGHVCAIMGWGEYEPIAEKYGVPICPTGFEPVDILQGILRVVQMLEREAERPAHASLFTGPASVGKATVARRFAGALLSPGDPDGIPGTARPSASCLSTMPGPLVVHTPRWPAKEAPSAVQMPAISSSIWQVITSWFFITAMYCRMSVAGVMGYEPRNGFRLASFAPATRPMARASLPMMFR